jgi:hypothetical protein
MGILLTTGDRVKRRNRMKEQKLRLLRVTLEGLEAKAESSEVEAAGVSAVLELVYELEKAQ